MPATDLFRRGLTAKAVLVMWLVSSTIVLLLLKVIESTLVYGLFETDYGLQYNLSWAVPYKTYTYTIYFFIAVPMALSGAVLIQDFRNGRKQVQLQEQKIQEDILETSKENVWTLCPSCRQVFSKPQQMVDFTYAHPKLVNVCPHCNTRLRGEKANQYEDENIRVLKPEQKEQNTKGNNGAEEDNS